MESSIRDKIYTLDMCCDGLIITANGITALSLNEYKKMHFSRIAKTKQSYRSVLDVILVSLGSKLGFGKPMYSLDEHGMKLIMPMFVTAKIAWGIGFKVERSRDLGNYTQKILQDAMVDANFFEDDNYKVIHEDRVFFMDEKKDQIKVFVEGEVNPLYKPVFVGGLVSDEIERYKSKLVIPEQEDDGEY